MLSANALNIEKCIILSLGDHVKLTLSKTSPGFNVSAQGSYIDIYYPWSAVHVF